MRKHYAIFCFSLYTMLYITSYVNDYILLYHIIHIPFYAILSIYSIIPTLKKSTYGSNIEAFVIPELLQIVQGSSEPLKVALELSLQNLNKCFSIFVWGLVHSSHSENLASHH